MKLWKDERLDNEFVDVGFIYNRYTHSDVKNNERTC